MRVVWLVPGFSSDENDWCIPALRHLAGEVALRCELHIVALQYPYRREVYRAFGATVHSLGGSNRGGGHTLPLWRDALRTIASLRPAVLHAVWAYEPGVIAGWYAPRLPTIIHLAGGELIDLPDIRYGLHAKWRTRLLLRWALRRAQIVTAGSHYLIDLAERFVPGREIVFAPLGTPHSLTLSPEMEKQIPVDGDQVILNVGSLEPVKDQALLLRAFKIVQDALPQARLVIAGRGRLDAELRSQCAQLNLAERVTFAGKVPHDQLPQLYRRAAVCVQTSRHEAQGMAVLEAASYGVPLIGTAVGAIADLSPEAAIAVPVSDEVALAQAIIALLRDPARRAQLGRKARECVAREYALTRAVDRTLTMYEGLRKM